MIETSEGHCNEEQLLLSLWLEIASEEMQGCNAWQFDSNKIKASFVPEADCHRVEAHEWISQ